MIWAIAFGVFVLAGAVLCASCVVVGSRADDEFSRGQRESFDHEKEIAP